MNCKMTMMAALLVAGAAQAANDIPYGVVVDATRSEYDMRVELLDLMKQGGYGYMRVDWDWWACQPTKDGGFDFSRYDKLVDEAEQRGITILPIVYGAPAWAKPAWEHADAYAEFCRATVIHYGKRIPVIELWNEENISSFWNKEDPDASKYVAMCKKAYKAIKEADPSIRVALGGVAGWAHDYIRDCYAAGGKDCFDIINVHPYTYPHPSDGCMETNLKRLREIMAEYGDEKKPLWITEIGWPTQAASLSGEGNFIAAGLKVALGDKKTWNVIYAATIPDNQPEDPDLVQSLAAQLPVGSKVRVCGPKETVKLLGEGGWDAVLYPPDETFPVDTFEAVHKFVKEGGTLVDLGGMPLWGPYRNLPDGTVSLSGGPASWGIYSRLHIDCDSWWIGKSELPTNKMLTVLATDAGLKAGVKQAPTGFRCGHFFTDKQLKPGDSWVPLVKGTNPLNGKDAVSTCVYMLNSDLKGRVVISGISGHRGTAFVVNEEMQASRYMRGLGLALAQGFEAFFYYNLRAREKDRFYSEDHFGVVHANNVPKLAWLAHRNFAVNRPVGSTQLDIPYSKDGFYYPQWKRPDGVIAGMAWNSVKRKMKFTFDAENINFVDMMGKPALVRNAGKGVYTLEVSENPVYFAGGKLVSFEEDK